MPCLICIFLGLGKLKILLLGRFYFFTQHPGALFRTEPVFFGKLQGMHSRHQNAEYHHTVLPRRIAVGILKNRVHDYIGNSA